MDVLHACRCRWGVVLLTGAVLACAAEVPPPQRSAGEAAPVSLERVASVATVAGPAASGIDDAAPPVALPPAPDPPRRPAPLEVPGFRGASHVGPVGAGSWPQPVTIVLHGNFDRPEWECATWAPVAAWRGFVLCPRGVPTPFASPREDRWTYRGGAAGVRREIAAAVAALEERYPGRVTREGTVLAGFSLGAILAPRIATDSPGVYPYLFLVEGGEDGIGGDWPRRLRAAGVRGIGLAMSAPGRRRSARDAAAGLRRRGIETVLVDMQGAGHDYRSDFGSTGREALAELLGRPDRDGGPPKGDRR
jgi:hypothetical protein